MACIMAQIVQEDRDGKFNNLHDRPRIKKNVWQVKIYLEPSDLFPVFYLYLTNEILPES